MLAWLVVALALRSLVPVGYMPVASADGGLAVVLCTAGGLRSVVLDAPRDPGPDQHEVGPLCPFAGVLHLGVPQAPIDATRVARLVDDGRVAPTLAAIVLAVRQAHRPRAPPLASI